jgi:hypothetical protein
MFIRFDVPALRPAKIPSAQTVSTLTTTPRTCASSPPIVRNHRPLVSSAHLSQCVCRGPSTLPLRFCARPPSGRWKILSTVIHLAIGPDAAVLNSHSQRG